MSSYYNTGKDLFKEYQLSEAMLETLALLEYEKPTQIQQEVIPLILAGKDVIAKSQTGTGKTAAFAIPICEQVNWEENYPQALILEPTRELSVQVQNEIFHIGRKKRLKVPAVFGGFPIDKQIQTLKQKSHIIVGTPGRVMDHIRRGTLNLEKIRYLVIDEADLMLDMGFEQEVNEIINNLEKSKQMLLFSATLDERIKDLTGKHMTDAVSVIIEARETTAELIEQTVYEVDTEDKLGSEPFPNLLKQDCGIHGNKYDVLLRILMEENPDSCMIFCATKEMVNVLYRKLKKDRVSCGMLHGDMDQSDRLKTIDNFRMKHYRYLIATDVAARGIDIENITHVINYDFPTGRESYVHRIGRTGRNGREGKAISLVTKEEKRMQQMVEEYINITLQIKQCPERTEQKEKLFRQKQKESNATRRRKSDALNRSIMRLSIGGGKKSKMRAGDVVGALCSIEEISADDIGIIDIRDSLTYVEILNGKGQTALTALQERPIKGKIRKIQITKKLS